MHKKAYQKNQRKKEKKKENNYDDALILESLAQLDERRGENCITTEKYKKSLSSLAIETKRNARLCIITVCAYQIAIIVV